MCDTNSINGTWLNGKRIESQREYVLCTNDVINFANALELIFNENTKLNSYDANHNFVVADEYTGGTKLVCKKCGKVKHESTLLFYDEKVDNIVTDGLGSSSQNYNLDDIYNGITIELGADIELTADDYSCDFEQPNFVGKVLHDKYLVLEQLHVGVWFKTYLVENIKTNKKWIMKVCDKKQKGYNDIIHEIIMQEPRMMMKFDHPTMPRILDIIEDDRYISIIRDYFEGEPLNIFIQRYGPVSAEKAIEWGKQLCEALSYLHNLTPPHIHRDIKPHNIILTPDGALKLIDFGIMRLYNPRKTEDTTILGTRGYAAPEQYGGLGQTDMRTDIFGLGMTLCELVTGKDPKKREYVHKPIRQIDPSLPKGLEYIISKCTEIDPKNRYQSCFELMDDLNNYTSLPKAKGFFGRFLEKNKSIQNTTPFYPDFTPND